MSDKKEMTVGEKQASLVVNNGFIDGLVKQIEEKVECGLVLPKGYNVSNALLGAYLVMKETTDKNKRPITQVCTQASLASSLMEMATLGLNVQRKQGYFVSYGDKCHFQRSYFGNITVARRYGLDFIHAEVVYNDDDFGYSMTAKGKVFDHHVQTLDNIGDGNIHNIKGAYAIAFMKNGDSLMEVMTLDEIKAAWKQGFGYREGNDGTPYGTHGKFSSQMAKKTVMNRVLKMITNTYGDESVTEAYENSEDIPEDELIQADVSNVIESEANTIDFADEISEIKEESVSTEKETEVTENVEETPTSESTNEIPDFMKVEDYEEEE